MNLREIRVLYAMELRSALRERNIVFMGLLLPVVMYPVLLWAVFSAFSFAAGQTQGFVSRVALKDVPPAHDRLRLTLEGDQQLTLVPPPADPVAAIRDGTLDAMAEFLPPEDSAAAIPDNFRLRITSDESRDRSTTARQRLATAVDRYRSEWLSASAAERGISPSEWAQLRTEARNVATGREMGSFLLELMLPAFLLTMITVGAFYPAIDTTAGERERSTWETTLSTAASRTSIVTAKYLYVATFSCLAGLLNLAAMAVSMSSVLAPLLGNRADSISFRLPLSALPVIGLGAVLLALFASAMMMIFASFARTFKEGQSMVTPFYLVMLLPTAFLSSPDITLTPTLAILPVANLIMVFRSAIRGVYDWPLVGLSLAVTAVLVVLSLALARALLNYEDFMTGSYTGTFTKFLKERLLKRGKNDERTAG